ncbi:efflux RND transporter periplasmic adaptor subunit [Rhizosphaericola mali]|uniref:HlyD family efflux transporter periplasmic adaptor subunit n=1 Tax=Rhizosphaericola mali TaxID=2545455 RepID=A0A5P2G1X2_9BACT|nr:HlyD family efflux transporter periplasmic adaptor subunit [Rhizosphaericola mali]QES88089.1 HlyD family efflux transporter periplasmic adaptor subunit [Rhizosphaericola mali]
MNNRIFSHKAVILLALLLSAASCKKVQTTSPLRKDIQQSVFANGFLEFDNQYTIAANAAGILYGQIVKEGDSVSAKQMIAHINSNSQESQVQQSTFVYKNAEQNALSNSAQLAQIEQQILQASSQLNQDKTNYQRYSELIATNSVSKQDYENAKLQYTNSLHNLDILQKKYTDTKTSLQLNANTSNSELKSQRAILDNYKAQADGAGVVIAVYRKNGEVLKIGDPIALIGNGSYIIKLYISEDDIVKVSLGQKISVHLNTYTDQVFWATVTKIYPGFDNDQQSYTIEAKFDQLPPKMFSGTQLQGNIQTGVIRNALVIPAAYLQKNNIVQLKDGSVKTVSIGAKDDHWVQILSGLSENDVLNAPKN